MKKMKKALLNTVEKLRSEEGINLRETPALFKWRYEELPDVQFEMLISEFNPLTMEENTTIQ